LIQEAPEPAFLLSAVVAFIEQIAHEHVLEHYSFASFEFLVKSVFWSESRR